MMHLPVGGAGQIKPFNHPPAAHLRLLGVKAGRCRQNSDMAICNLPVGWNNCQHQDSELLLHCCCAGQLGQSPAVACTTCRQSSEQQMSVAFHLRSCKQCSHQHPPSSQVVPLPHLQHAPFVPSSCMCLINHNSRIKQLASA